MMSNITDLKLVELVDKIKKKELSLQKFLYHQALW